HSHLNRRLATRYERRQAWHAQAVGHQRRAAFECLATPAADNGRSLTALAAIFFVRVKVEHSKVLRVGLPPPAACPVLVGSACGESEGADARSCVGEGCIRNEDSKS